MHTPLRMSRRRIASLNECLRAFWWRVYGWNEPKRYYDVVSDPEAPTLQELASGVSYSGLVARIVHDVAKDELGGRDLDPNSAHSLEQLQAHALRDFDLVVAGDERAGLPFLLERFYGADEDRLALAREELLHAVEALFFNEHFQAIGKPGVGLRILESTLRTPNLISSGVSTDIPVALLYQRDPKGDLIFVDWTLSAYRAAGGTVGWYAAQAVTSMGARPEEVVLVSVDLQLHTESVARGTTTALDELRQELLDAVEKVRPLVEGGDLVRNAPLPIESFPMLPEKSKPCRYCAFRRLCGRG